ncbi:MAG TPA: hypothetical protein VFE62_28995 [Gemmataceae bacterium]|nr:hypothetical protein [Gemmataceae bacterium]
MKKPFTCNTRSVTGNMVLGVLFLGCGILLVGTPCIAGAGTLFGSVSPPRDANELKGTLCVLAVCLAMAAATLSLGVLCLNATLLPRTLEITNEGIELRWFQKKLGNVPFANVKEVFVKTRAMAGETAEGAYWQAFLTGGFIAATIARNRFNPNEPIGIVITLMDGKDPDTFWPRTLFKKNHKKRLEVLYHWKLPHKRIVEKITKAVSRHKEIN